MTHFRDLCNFTISNGWFEAAAGGWLGTRGLTSLAPYCCTQARWSYLWLTAWVKIQDSRLGGDIASWETNRRYLEANCFLRRWVLPALRSQSLQSTMTTDLYLFTGSHSNWMCISEQCQVSEVLVLFHRIQALAGVCGHGHGSMFYTSALCRADGFGAFVCLGRLVSRREIPAFKSILLEAVKSNASCSEPTQILMWDEGLFSASPLFLFSLPVGDFLPGYVHCKPNLCYISQVLSLSVFGNHTGNFCLVLSEESLSGMMYPYFLHSPSWWCWTKHLSWTRWFSPPVTQICACSGGPFK